MTETKRTFVMKVGEEGVRREQDILVSERDVTVFLNGESVLKTTCSPGGLKELVIGYLVSEGWIAAPSEIDLFQVAEDEGAAWATTFRKGSQDVIPPRVWGRFTLSKDGIFKAVEACVTRGQIFRKTGGTHAAAIASPEGALHNFFEDISRTCALEKALGGGLLTDLPLKTALVVLSSRVSSQFVRKVARCAVPLIAAVSAPTWNAVEEARRLGICLCGFVREERLNIYSHPWRVGL
jgi:FdhD protein